MMLALSSPLFAYLELTPACANRCPGCGNVFADDRRPQPLSAAQWHDVLVQLKPHVLQLKLTGGEPTLHREFAAIIQTIHALDMPFVLFTNARWSDPSGLIALLRATPHQCRGLLVSLHGATAASHDAFTDAPGSFVETVRNISRATQAGLPITTSTVITCYNYAEVCDIVRLSRDLGAHHAVFNRYLGAPLPSVEPTNEQLQSAIQAVDTAGCLASREQQPPVKFGNCIPQCFFPSSSTGCLAGITHCTVDPWGNVRPCNHAPLLCGNLREQTIEEIWHGPTLKRWRDLVPSLCVKCDALTQCHGGCRAVALIRDSATDPLMRVPLPAREKAPRDFMLHEEARPIKQCIQRAEPFGFVLIRGTNVLPVTAQAEPVLNSLNGTFTLRQIQEQFGQEALDFVGSLSQQGLVRLL